MWDTPYPTSVLRVDGTLEWNSAAGFSVWPSSRLVSIDTPTVSSFRQAFAVKF